MQHCPAAESDPAPQPPWSKRLGPIAADVHRPRRGPLIEPAPA